MLCRSRTQLSRGETALLLSEIKLSLMNIWRVRGTVDDGELALSKPFHPLTLIVLEHILLSTRLAEWLNTQPLIVAPMPARKRPNPPPSSSLSTSQALLPTHPRHACTNPPQWKHSRRKKTSAPKYARTLILPSAPDSHVNHGGNDYSNVHAPFP